MEKLEDRAVRRFTVASGLAGRGVVRRVNLAVSLRWERCCFYSSREATAVSSPLAKKWGTATSDGFGIAYGLQGLLCEVPDTPASHQPPPFSSLTLKSGIFLYLLAN